MKEDALRLSLSVDIPFWPQLPKYRYEEDMYAQFAQHFPGLIIDEEHEILRFSHQLFTEQLDIYLEESLIYDRCWLTPSRCCLINADGVNSVEQSYKVLKDIA